MIIHFQQEISEHGHTQPSGCELLWPVPKMKDVTPHDAWNYWSWRFGMWFSFSKGWLLGEPCSFSGVSYFFRYRIWRSPVAFIPYHPIKKIFLLTQTFQLFFSWEDAIAMVVYQKKILEMFFFVGCFHLTSSHTFTYPPCRLRCKSRYKGRSLGGVARVFGGTSGKNHLGCNLPGCQSPTYFFPEHKGLESDFWTILDGNINSQTCIFWVSC